MFNQKSQDIALPDGVVKILFSQEKFALSDGFFGILGVNPSKRANRKIVWGRTFSLPREARERFLYCAFDNHPTKDGCGSPGQQLLIFLVILCYQMPT